MIVRGRKAFRTSGPGDHDPRDATVLAGGLVITDVGVGVGALRARGDPVCAHRAKASLWAMVIEGWLDRAARLAPDRVAVETL